MKQRRVYAALIISAAMLIAPAAHSAGQTAPAEPLDLVIKFKTAEAVGEISRLPVVKEINRVFPDASAPELQNVYRLKVNGNNLNSGLWRVLGRDVVDWWQKENKLTTAQAANDEFYTSDQNNTDLQWYLPKVGAEQAWEKINRVPEVVVAIIDTGIFANHQDLNDGRIVAGRAIYCPEIVNESCEQRVRTSIPAGEDSDDNGHGTAVASIIGAMGNNFAGIAGVAWEVKLMPVKVLNKDGIGLASDVAEGIVWAAQNGADIINLSLGGATVSNSQVISLATELATKNGALVVAAAGNDKAVGSDLDLSPSDPVCSDGANNYVVGVAALASNDTLASFSNFGQKCIDIAAPGVKILAAHFDPEQAAVKNIYAYRSGTSFSAPLVSGAAALIKGLNPSWLPGQIHDHLVATAQNIDASNLDTCAGQACAGKLGGGRLDVAAAVGSVITTPTTPPITPVNDNIIKAADGTDFYLVEDGQKKLLTNFVIQQRQINVSAVAVLSQSEFNALPTGAPVPPLDNTLIKAAGHPLVSMIKDGIKRPLSFLSFTKHKFSFLSVVSLPDSYVAGLPAGKVLPPPERTLLRGQTNPTVFVVENDTLHAMNLTAFNNRGFKFNDVNYVSDEEVGLYPIGDTYLQ